LTLSDSTVTTSGDTSSFAASLARGLDAAVLVKSASRVGLVNFPVTPIGAGATRVLATGSGATVGMSGGSIPCSDRWAHGAAVACGLGAKALTGGGPCPRDTAHAGRLASTTARLKSSHRCGARASRVAASRRRSSSPGSHRWRR